MVGLPLRPSVNRDAIGVAVSLRMGGKLIDPAFGQVGVADANLWTREGLSQWHGRVRLPATRGGNLHTHVGLFGHRVRNGKRLTVRSVMRLCVTKISGRAHVCLAPHKCQ